MCVCGSNSLAKKRRYDEGAVLVAVVQYLQAHTHTHTHTLTHTEGGNADTHAHTHTHGEREGGQGEDRKENVDDASTDTHLPTHTHAHTQKQLLAFLLGSEKKVGEALIAAVLECIE
jgi:hypothetical protein